MFKFIDQFGLFHTFCVELVEVEGFSLGEVASVLAIRTTHVGQVGSLVIPSVQAIHTGEGVYGIVRIIIIGHKLILVVDM